MSSHVKLAAGIVLGGLAYTYLLKPLLVKAGLNS